MSDPNTATGEQPAPDSAPTAPIPTVGEQPIVQDHSATLATLDRDQLGNALFGGKPIVTPAAPAKEEAPKPDETPSGEQPKEVPQEKPDTDKDQSLRRLALGGIPMSERQQMAEVTRMIRDGEAKSQVEALTKMGVLQPAAPVGEQPPATPEEVPPDAPATPTTVAELEARIAELRAERDKADDDFDKPEVRRLTAEIEDSVGLLAQARLEAVSQQQTARTWQQQYVTAVDEMEAAHDWATDESSPLYRMLDDKVTAARARNDAALHDPRFIIAFADEVAALVKQAPVAKPPSSPATKAPPPPAIPERVVGSGVAPAHTEGRTLTPEEAKVLVHQATKEELSAALFRS